MFADMHTHSEHSHDPVCRIEDMLQAQLEQTHPALCKPIKLVTSRYNQDLSTGALLVEVGTAGNTHDEAMAAAEYLAEGILALAKAHSDANLAAAKKHTDDAIAAMFSVDGKSIKLNEENKAYVAEVSTDLLVNGSMELHLVAGSASI